MSIFFNYYIIFIINVVFCLKEKIINFSKKFFVKKRSFFWNRLLITFNFLFLARESRMTLRTLRRITRTSHSWMDDARKRLRMNEQRDPLRLPGRRRKNLKRIAWSRITWFPAIGQSCVVHRAPSNSTFPPR